MTPIDTLVHARWVAPVRPAGRPLEHHAVAVDDGRIVAVLPSAEARETFDAGEVVALDRHLLTPGFVNAHTHAAMSLMRGIANDKPLLPWLTENIWPLEAEHMSPTFVADGTDLAIAEMLRGGTTCFNDMYFYPDVVAERVDAAGVRARLGLIALDFPTVWASNADEYLEKGLAVADRWRGHPRLGALFAPHAPYTVSDGPLARIRTLADEMDIGVHMHVHETAGEIDDSVDAHGQRPLARLERLGLVNPGFVAVHMTALTAHEIALCAERGVAVVHAPESNLKLGSGLCPVAALVDAGATVALGTDGAASNNDLDMIGEMGTAALVAKIPAGDAGAVPAEQALTMATLGGAAALGLADTIGSLEPGKAADLCAIDLGRIETTPVYDPVAALVYSAGRDQVSDTWVAGRRLLADRVLTTLEANAVRARADGWRARLAGHAD